MDNEVWEPVPGHSDYIVSSLGRVAHIRVLEPNCRTGYLSTTLLPDGAARRAGGKRPSKRVLVHRLVAEAFIGPAPEGHVVRHRDGVRSHNTPDNLCYGTHADNAEDARGHGTLAVGDRCGAAKITEGQAREILRRYAAEGPTKLAAEFGLSREHVSGIGNGRYWRHL